MVPYLATKKLFTKLSVVFVAEGGRQPSQGPEKEVLGGLAGLGSTWDSP